MTTSSVAGPRRSSKALPKAKLAPKNRGHGLCLVVWCPSDPLQLSESRWNHYIWEVCSANQWGTLTIAKPAAGTNQQKGSNSSPRQLLMTHCTINASKVEQVGLKSFASSTIFTWPFAKQLLLPQVSRQHFSGKTLPQPAGHRKCFPRVCQILKHGFLCYRNKQTYFSLAKKNVVIVMVPILINKDVFEPSYNDLKFMVENCNYVCINLIISDSYLCQCCRL